MSFHQLHVHLVWATFERAPWVDTEVEEDVWTAMASQCRSLKTVPVGIGGMADHIHVLATFPPTLPISRLVSELKGMSSHLMTHRLRPGQPFRWQEGYSAFTLRGSDLAVVARYIREQRQHHSSHRLWEELELPQGTAPSRPRPASLA